MSVIFSIFTELCNHYYDSNLALVVHRRIFPSMGLEKIFVFSFHVEFYMLRANLVFIYLLVEYSFG